MFPFVIWAIYWYYLVKKDDQGYLFKRYGVLLDNVYGVRYQKYDIAIQTVVGPMIRCFIIAVVITVMN